MMERVIQMLPPSSGWVVIDKSEGFTSMSVTSRVKRALGVKKAGHGGTLDPFATGVLPIALGEATKVVSFALDGIKTYRFTIRWGQETTTQDPEGEICATSSHRPSKADIEAILPAFRGEISQTPSRFSAIKINGVPAYQRARRQEDFTLKSRFVIIYDLRLLKIPDEDHALFEVTCGKGTYVRSLGHDLAQKLGTVGHLVALRRTVVGPFHENNAILLDSILEMGHDQGASIYPLEVVLDDILALQVDEKEAQRLRHGLTLLCEEKREIGWCSHQGKAVALVRQQEGFLSPFCVFNP